MPGHSLGYSEVLVLPMGPPVLFGAHGPPPLEGIFLKDLFDLPSPRLQRMCEKVAMYSFRVQWTPGKTHLIADALSRAPLFSPQDLPDLEIDTAITCLSATSSSSLDIIYSAIDLSLIHI